MPVVAYHRGLKKVNLKSEANFVTMRDGNNYLCLPKKLVKVWDELPERV